MKILILGGTGVISSEITRQGLLMGHDITIFNRGKRKPVFDCNAQVIIGDKSDQEDFAKKFKNCRFDTVIDMICYNEEDAKQTIDVFKGKTEQIIFTSTSAAYAKPYKSFPIREECEDYCEDENFPYGLIKAKMEKFIIREMEAGANPKMTIIRPSLTFGLGSTNIGVLRQNYNIVDRINKNKPLLLFGDGTALWSFTFAEDLAKGYLLSCKNPNTYSNWYSIAYKSIGIWKDLYLTVGEILGKKVEFAYAPSSMLNAAMPSLFNHLEVEKKYSAIFECEKFKKAVPEFEATVSLREGLTKMINWWETQGNPVDENKDRLEDVICDKCKSFERQLTEALKDFSV